MSYFVYASLERTSYDKNSVFKEFTNKEDALSYYDEINNLSKYDNINELLDAVESKEINIKLQIDRPTDSDIIDWLYDNYSELICYEDELLRYVADSKLINGSVFE